MENRKISLEIKQLDNYIIRKVFEEGKKECVAPLSPIQVRIIVYLIENKDKEIYQKDLEKEFNVRRSTISGILKTMEKHNIITKSLSENDGRSKRIILSSSSIDSYKRLMSKFKELDKSLKNGITDDELEIFFNVIDKMKNNIMLGI